jgi:HAD superfamily hydrolase (TIGR01509 family)
MKLQIPAGDFRAYLFDCDGTIADSMPLHYIGWQKALAEWNCPFDETLFYAWGGRPPAEIVLELNRMRGLQMPVEAIIKFKESCYFELLPQLEPIEEVLEHIDAMHRRIPFAVVSGSNHKSITNSLNAIGLLDKFDLIIGSEDYTRGKPAPDCFLIAAERLGIAPEHCLVFEDTDFGIQAATAAGMASARVPSPLERRAEIERGKGAESRKQTSSSA